MQIIRLLIEHFNMKNDDNNNDKKKKKTITTKSCAAEKQIYKVQKLFSIKQLLSEKSETISQLEEINKVASVTICIEQQWQKICEVTMNKPRSL